jgi:tetratricopeptide (TPR) repeat protein
MGFFLSSNSMAAVVVLLLVISIGVAVQRMKDDPSDRAGIALLLAVPMAGWMIFYTQSRTAYVTPVLGLALLAAAWRGRRWLAQRSRHAFWMGMGVVGLGAMAVIGHGLYHKSLVHPSLTFRWNYWVGGMRIFLQHPLAGIGLDNFGYHYLAARLPEASEEVKDPHNFLVKFLTELGVLGGMLCVAWLGRLAWEVTRPIVPPTGKAPLPRYRGARAINTIAIIAGLGLLINIVASLDFTADKGYVIFEVLRKLSMFALLLIGASVAAIKSLQAPELDARPAPFLLYAMLMALGIFLVHNLIDFSLFEPGAMMTFAFIAGSALGVRTPSVAGQKKRTAAAAVSLGICIVLWLVAGGFVWAPTAVAEDAANDAGIAMRNNRPDKALRLLEQAREHQPLNADYAFRAAQSIISSNPAYSPLVPDLLEKAIRRNPLAVEYYLTRARYLLRNSSEQRDQIIKDFMRVMELNPNEVSLRVEFADALASFNTAEDRARAVEQYREAQRYNAMLKPNEPKRLKPDKVSEIEKRIAELKK